MKQVVGTEARNKEEEPQSLKRRYRISILVWVVCISMGSILIWVVILVWVAKIPNFYISMGSVPC